MFVLTALVEPVCVLFGKPSLLLEEKDYKLGHFLIATEAKPADLCFSQNECKPPCTFHPSDRTVLSHNCLNESQRQFLPPNISLTPHQD